jgi:hypothetical protein
VRFTLAQYSYALIHLVEAGGRTVTLLKKGIARIIIAVTVIAALYATHLFLKPISKLTASIAQYAAG